MLKLWTCTISNSTPYRNYWNYKFRFERRDVQCMCIFIMYVYVYVYMYMYIYVLPIPSPVCTTTPLFYALRIELMLHKYNILL